MTEPLLHVDDLKKHFPVTRGVLGRVVGNVRAVDGVSFDIAHGETLGLVGESGCGKTSVGRCILRLIEPTGGRVLFGGKDVLAQSPAELRQLRREMQVIFQDPFSSLNPRMRVIDIVGESLEVHGIAKGEAAERRVAELMRRVGLSPSWINRYPHEFSGGQRQRIGVARAIALDPKLIVCDEAVSALDVSIQAQVLNLLSELRREMGLSYLFIAHDLSVVRHISHRVSVMYLGEIVELAPTKRLFEAAGHPYTRALLSAIPVPDPNRERHRIVLAGDVPSPANPPSGCRFHTRCPAVMDRCRREIPPNYLVEADHPVKCFHAEGMQGDPDWHRRVTERIERAMKENGQDRRLEVVREEEAAALEIAAAQTRRAAAELEGVDQARPTAGLAIMVLAAVLVVAGHWVIGLVAALGAHWGLVRPRVKRRRRADAIVALVLASSLALSLLAERLVRRHRAEAQLSRLAAELEARAEITGAFPDRLSDLGWRLHPIFDRGRPDDPWGRPWLYRAPGAEGRPFDLGSLGADGVRSDDDIGSPPVERRDRR